MNIDEMHWFPCPEVEMARKLLGEPIPVDETCEDDGMFE